MESDKLLRESIELPFGGLFWPFTYMVWFSFVGDIFGSKPYSSPGLGPWQAGIAPNAGIAPTASRGKVPLDVTVLLGLW